MMRGSAKPCGGLIGPPFIKLLVVLTLAGELRLIEGAGWSLRPSPTTELSADQPTAATARAMMVAPPQATVVCCSLGSAVLCCPTSCCAAANNFAMFLAPQRVAASQGSGQ